MTIRRANIYLFILFVICTVLGVTWVWGARYQSQLEQHDVELERFASHIQTQLDKYAHLPQLLAQDSEIIAALNHPDNSAQLDLTNRYLSDVNKVIEAADSYLLDAQGNTIAASNWNLTRSFVGKNFAWRPYFSQAIQGQSSQYYALGSTSGQRGYYYSYPVVYAAEIIGVIVIKMDLSRIEDNWSSERSYFVATDPNQVIFMSSNSKWLFHSLISLNQEQKQRIYHSRQYLDAPLDSIGLSGDMVNDAHTELTNHRLGGGQGDYIVSSKPLDDVALTIRVLTPKRIILWSALSFVLFASLLFVIAYLSLQLFYQRHLKKRQFEQLQSEAKQKLEFQVMERTAELHAEIDERIKTEHALRQTQDELVQAAKLAVLGQMSASISHELNNPLAAIRSFADNGRRYLDKGKHDTVDSNLARISALTERMAKISDQLKSFARKSDVSETQIVTLTPLIMAAHELIAPQLKSQQIQLTMKLDEQAIQVDVNPIQFEQVIINLLTNAMQAMPNQATREVQILSHLVQDQVIIHIDDNGEGLSEQLQHQLFEPFYTTKKNGLGLGLSISQQIMQAMGGTLSCAASPLGGARFTVTLPTVQISTKD
ncbi:sensor histidine kinase [Vibrio sp. LaRot3]|uniref:sensor histidine kinase n=1 Tax=Vibrio sp. LaRot3 TaxID=2998829 RepID=UPI0022CDCA6D|nr:ATP-binding protein [Vibrio sp. LaRot3]MDA0147116.1 ATP-binding protein [Vibrio sp. LaRot3]